MKPVSVRQAELVAALILAALSVYMMWKSTELPIGWRKDFGPGGGAFPFYLSLGMLITSGLIFIRTLMGLTPESQSKGPFLDPASRRLFYTVGLALTAMILAIGGIWVLPGVGVYVAVPLFMIFYMRVLGKHSWVTTLTISLATPVVTFLFFEKLLLILLPKGITDQWFYIFF
jgi:hypothetical protein